MGNVARIRIGRHRTWIAAVVRDMTTLSVKPGHVTQLVFGDEILSERRAGTDTETCKEDVRKRFRWYFDALPYDSLLDKIYRLLTRGWVSGAAGTETLPDFLEKSCSTGHLSRTFAPDLPRSFVAGKIVYFEGLAIRKNESPSFGTLFPGAGGIISFSYVGFNSATDEAMVSASFFCGSLCGEGWHYILKKRRGKWEVVNKRMIWGS
jgi:hypothetical protein